jgi:hypothetical protein
MIELLLDLNPRSSPYNTPKVRSWRGDFSLSNNFDENSVRQFAFDEVNDTAFDKAFKHQSFPWRFRGGKWCSLRG